MPLQKCPFWCGSGLAWNECSCKWAIEAQRRGMIPAKIAYMAALEAGKEPRPDMSAGKKKPEPAPKPRVAAKPRQQPVVPQPPRDLQLPAVIIDPADSQIPVPIVNGKRLPTTYEEAKVQIAALDEIEVCQSWADQYEMLATYAGRIRDEPRLVFAVRARAEAVRRVGELIKAIPAASPGKRPGNWGHPGTPNSNRQSATTEVGLSPHQRRQAERIAAASRAEFDAAIERAHPATLKELARLGTKPDNRQSRAEVPPLFKLLDGFDTDSAKIDLVMAFQSLSEDGREELARKFARLEAWVGRAALTIRGVD